VCRSGSPPPPHPSLTPPLSPLLSLIKSVSVLSSLRKLLCGRVGGGGLGVRSNSCLLPGPHPPLPPPPSSSPPLSLLLVSIIDLISYYRQANTCVCIPNLTHVIYPPQHNRGGGSTFNIQVSKYIAMFISKLQ